MMHTSTSPSYPIVASIETAAAMLRGNPGKRLINRSVERALHFRKEVQRLKEEADGWFFDIWQPEAVDKAECWPVAPGEDWHGFKDADADHMYLDPVKVTILTPGMDEQGNMDEEGIPAALVAKFLDERGVERARQLFAADVIGRAELQRRESELAIASAEQRAAADQLRVLGMSQAAISRLGNNGAINSVTPVVSTVAGTVVERRITQGQVVQPADALYVVADLSEVWVTAEVPEQQAALVRAGQQVDIEVPALGARLTGKLIYVADTVNPETRTVTVRSRVDNAGRQLKPAMLATMLIQAAAVERIVVPAEAVVRENNADHVFVETAPRSYRLTPVRLGPEGGGQRPVLDGLKAGERIVAAGAFHLNTERKRKELE